MRATGGRGRWRRCARSAPAGAAERPAARVDAGRPRRHRCLAPMLSGFVARAPGDLTLELDLSPRRVDLIGENFDLAHPHGRSAGRRQLAARRLATMHRGPVRVAAPPDARTASRETPEALRAAHGLLILGRDGRPGALVAATRIARATRRWHGMPMPRTVANSPDAADRASRRRGWASWPQPSDYAAPHVRAGEIRRVLPDWCLPPVSAWAVFPGRRLMPAKTRAFLENSSARERGLPAAVKRAAHGGPAVTPSRGLRSRAASSLRRAPSSTRRACRPCARLRHRREAA